MTVDAIMSRDVETVAPDVTLMEIQEVLRKRGFRHLLVVEDGALVGVISDRDVLRVISPFLDTLSESARDVKTLMRPASDVMRSDPVSASPDTSVEDAASMLLEHTISCLPVIGDDAQIQGIVTSKDLLRCLINQ
jgi:acetoin utilization protein AcuB